MSFRTLLGGFRAIGLNRFKSLDFSPDCVIVCDLGMWLVAGAISAANLLNGLSFQPHFLGGVVRNPMLVCIKRVSDSVLAANPPVPRSASGSQDI